MLQFKDCFLRGQGTNMRTRNCLKNIDMKVLASASKYQAAHRALIILGGLLNKVGWKNQLQHLADEDICSMMDGTDDARSEGQRKLSWIWLFVHTRGVLQRMTMTKACKMVRTYSNTNTALITWPIAIRIEWCHARACAS